MEAALYAAAGVDRLVLQIGLLSAVEAERRLDAAASEVIGQFAAAPEHQGVRTTRDAYSGSSHAKRRP